MATLMGGPGNDVLHAQLSDNLSQIDGGGGINTLNADWSASNHGVDAGVSVSSGNIGTASNGPMTLLANIQRLNLVTGAGNDTLNVYGADEVVNFDGGGGVNRFSASFGYGSGFSTFTGDIDFTLDTTPGAISTFLGQGSTVRNVQSVLVVTGTGNDRLTGGDGADYLVAGGGINVVNGGGGDDELHSVALDGVDTIDGGSGVNTWLGYFVGASQAYAFTDTGGDSYTLSNGTTLANIQRVFLQTGSGDDVFVLNNNHPSLIDGGLGFDTLTSDLSSATGDITVRAFVNIDPAAPGASGDITEGFNPNGTSFSSMESVNISTGSGDDTFIITYSSIPGENPSFNFDGGAGADAMYGGAGDDTLAGGIGDNFVSGGDGNDIISGSGALSGDAGNDILTAEADFTKYPPAVLLTGGLGDDTLIGLGINVTPGGPYAETIANYADPPWLVGATSAVTVNLDLIGPQDTGGAGIDTLVNVAGVIGTQWGDTLSGGLSLEGGGGDDTLRDSTFAVYDGVLADYAVTTDSAGVTTVRDLRPGAPDGVDTLTHVAQLQFSDQTVDILSANAPPDPGADSLATPFGVAVTVSAASLLTNDFDLEGDALSLTAVSGAQHGVVSLSGGNVIFTPYAGYVGAAGFSYTVDDGHGGTALGQVSVNVTGVSPAYLYRGGMTAAETIDFTGDAKSHQVLVGSGDTTVLMGSGGGSAHLGAGTGVVVGGTGRDSITFGPGLGTATGGAGPDAFIFVKGQIADPSLHAGHYDTITDFTGAGGWVPGRDFIWLQGFSRTATLTYEHDLSGDPTAHLYRIDDGAYHAEFVLQYVGAGVALAFGQYGFL